MGPFNCGMVSLERASALVNLGLIEPPSEVEIDS